MRNAADCCADITFSNWTGDCVNGSQRAPIYVDCPAGEPCTDIVLKDINIWTEAGNTEYYKCANAYGSGYCLRNGTTHTAYNTTTVTVTTPPTDYAAPYMPSDLSSGLGVTTSIAVPTVPTTFFPGATPATRRAYQP